MAEDTIFRVYSMTKPVTSIALMQLHEHGHFRLTDPVHRFLPAWRDLGVFQGGSHPQFLTTRPQRAMTVQDLLRHTSGLTYGFMHRTNVDAAYRKLGIGAFRPFDGNLAEMCDQLSRLPLEFSPGTAWNYSVSTDVCGHLVELISGEPFDRYLERHVLGPLGMEDTAFFVPPEKADRLAACYERGPDKRLRLQDDPERSRYLEKPKLLGGGGGLVSTAADYLRFARMLRGGGELDGQRIIGRKTLELMTRNHLPGGRDLSEFALAWFAETPYAGVGFGLGFSVQMDCAKGGIVGSEGEFAWGGAASTAFWVDPVEDLIVIFMTQFMPSRTFDFRGQLKSIVYGAIVD
jgi:CubicO group peptidase (beta-lactamase class C family)